MCARRIAAGTAGLLAVAVGFWGVLSSMGGIRGYTPRLHFISMLALPQNEHAERFNNCVVVAGILTAIAGALFARDRVSRSSRRAAYACTVAGVAIACVGFLPLTRMWPHLVAAIVSGSAGASASLFAAHSLRALPENNTVAWPARAVATTAATVVLLSTVGAIGYFVFVTVNIDAGSMSALMDRLPGAMVMRVYGMAINPLAILEWIFFAVLAAELAAASLVKLAAGSKLGIRRDGL